MNREICRLCLAHPSVCFSLLENNVSEMLEALTSIKVNSNDAMSTITCMKCLLNVKLAFNIQQNILKVDAKLKNDANVKLEVTEPQVPEELAVDLLKIDPHRSNQQCSSCVVCGVSMEEKLLIKHIQEHFSDKQVCDICSKSFNDIEEYKKHISFQHVEFKHVDYKCKICDATFRYRSLYKVHQNQAHINMDTPTKFKLGIKSKQAVKLLLEPKIRELGPFTCETCQKQFQYKRQLNCHTHQKKKCPICNAEIAKRNLKKHIMNHSSGPQICELCGASLRNLDSLRGHFKYTHSQVIFNCDECGKVFRKSYTYLLHKKKHAGEKTHVCETCGKSFLTFFYLNKHIKSTHLKLRPFICEYCVKAFSSKFALRTHVRQHTNETPYKCEVCGEGFRQNVSLKAHRKSKHNIVEAKTCACPVCGKEFSSEQGIISHMRLH